MNRSVAPPSGSPAPTSVTLGDERIELVPLAEAVAERYFEEFPEDLQHYGDAARAWEIHDTCHTLQWAVLDVKRVTSLEAQIVWLSKVLRSRGFPLEHLARNLELAAEVVEPRLGDAGNAVGERLRFAAEVVRVS